MHLTLIGGGWNAAAFPLTYGPFLAAAGASPGIACVVLDDGDGAAQYGRWARALTASAPCRPRPVLVPLGQALDVAQLSGADGVFVCGGLTPAYADALAPAAAELRRLVHEDGVPYAGYSAGAAVAAEAALVGGWRDGEVTVCAEEAAEDLDQVSVRGGLGLVPFTVEVHCAQWGTLSRLASVVASSATFVGCGIDEDTAVHVVDGSARVAGLGRAYRLEHGATGRVLLQVAAAGETLEP